jgi:4-amino-4-deoxy-L-arabinose transferase-like glycosyltransferase
MESSSTLPRPRIARRTLDNLAWAMLAVTLGWLAQGLFADGWLTEGLLLYAVAIPLFAVRVRLARPAPLLKKTEEDEAGGARQAPAGRAALRTVPLLPPLRIAGGMGGWLGGGLMVGAAMVSLIAMRLFGFAAQDEDAMVIYLLSLLLFGVGAWLVEPPDEDHVAPQEPPEHAGPRPELPGASQPQDAAGTADPLVPIRIADTQGDMNYSDRLLGLSRLFHFPRLSLPAALLLAILALGLFFRLFHFFSLPFGTWYDEAVAGIDARRVLQDPNFRPVFWESMNHPAHHLYLFALALRLFGDSTTGLRVVSVFFGMATVLAAYLFGREVGGQRWGLLLAFLIATLRWDVNFSRIAMNGIDTPFFEFLTLYFALRAVRGGRGRVQAVAWTGLSFGLGLCFYSGFRLFAATLVLFGLIWLVLIAVRARRSAPPPLGLRRRGRQSPPAAGGEAAFQGVRLSLLVGLAAVAAWLAIMPVAQFAVRQSSVFWQRTRNVSIFEHRDQPDLVQALLQSTEKHLLMFNYRGDNNGRHNLPGTPMLDRLSAVMFALGLGLALARRKPVDMFFLLLLPVGLLGGILSLDFEAPQSLRSIATMPAVVYFVALSLDALWSELKWATRIVRPHYSLGAVVLGLGFVAVSNGYTYFVEQAQNSAVWAAFSAPETLVGKRMAELGPDPVYYLSPFFDHPSIRFIAPADPARSVRKIMRLPDPLPAREPADRPVAYFIHPDEKWVFDLARQLYPSAQFEVLPIDSNFPPSAYVVELKPSDVASLQGLDFRYWAGDDWDGQATPVASGRSPVVDVSWPDRKSPAPPFVAEWSGVLYAPAYGQYTLAVEAPGRVALTLDGQTVEGSGALSTTPLLALGNHSLRLRAAGGQGHVRLTWQPATGEPGVIPQWALYSLPVTAHGLLGKYYPNPDWQGTPALERVDPLLDVYFHLTPLPRPYSVEWTGALEVPYGGVYALGLRSVDQSQLYLDGQLLVSATQPDQIIQELATLRAGLHDLRITFKDQTSRTRIHLYWTRPGGEQEIIPSAYLWPGRAEAGASPAPPSPTPVEMPPMDLTWQATWGGGRFAEPRDVAVGSNAIYVADTARRQVQILGRDGTVHKTLTGGQEPFEEPLALGVDSGQRLLVLDSLQGWIYRFDAEGNPVDRIAGPTSQTFHARGMTVLSDDTIIVADTGGARLVFFGPDGTIMGRIGSLGNAPGQMREPTDVAVDAAGTYYVLEAYNRRLQRLDRQGNSLGVWPIPTSVAMDGPHAAWAADGSLLVTDPEEGAILRYAPDGRLLNRWTQAGEATLRRPVGIYVDAATATLYVTDIGTRQVVVYTIK